MRPRRLFSRQSRASSIIWWWAKPSTPSARGRTLSGELLRMISWIFSSIWAVACSEERKSILWWCRGSSTSSFSCNAQLLVGPYLGKPLLVDVIHHDDLMVITGWRSSRAGHTAHRNTWHVFSAKKKMFL